MSSPKGIDASDGTARSGLYCKFHLHVTARTERGQSIRVSGSSFVMGRNQPKNALQLVTTPEEYPVWRTMQPIVVPRGVTHTYQYALFDGGKIRRWEDIQPRTVDASSAEVTMRDVFGVAPGEETKAEQHGEGGSGSPLNKSRMMAKTRSESSDSLDSGGSGGLNRPPAAMEELTRKLTAGMTKSAKELMRGRHLILACFHLPVILNRDATKGTWSARWNDSLISRSDDSVASDVSTTWIGTVAHRGRLLTEADKLAIRQLLAPMSCVPIFASQDLVDRAYLGYCKQQLWPSFHNVDILDLTNSAWNGEAHLANPELSWDQSTVGNFWEAYTQLSQTFADEVARVTDSEKVSAKGAVVWVHDYHLMLLPEYIANNDMARHGYRKNQIIFFLHIPFSTSEVFRSLQNGGKLLRGMIHSDLVGFHAYDHARHFINACKRNLGLKAQTRNGGMLGVEFEGRTVLVAMRHVSIETAKLDRKMAQCNSGTVVEMLKQRHAGKKIVAGLDTCQRLSGVALKLLGMEQLLDANPSWRGKVVLVQRCFRPKSRPDDEEKTSSENWLLANRINAKYPGSVFYDEIDSSRLTSGERLGLWLAADVLLNTSVREGLNLDCFEYVYVKEDPGVMVQSEFSSTVSVLNGAMRINPFDIKSWTLTLDEALNMSETERRARKMRDIGFVSSRPSSLWTKQILNDMSSLDASDDGVDGSGTAWSLDVDEQNPGMAGDGTSDGAFSTGSFFSRLDPNLIAKAYGSTSRRVFIFDYGGTLRENENVGKYIKDDINPCHKGRDLPPEVIGALKALSEDSRNTVYIISGLAQKALEFPFRTAPEIGLAAQNGLCYTLQGEAGMAASASAASVATDASEEEGGRPNNNGASMTDLSSLASAGSSNASLASMGGMDGSSRGRSMSGSGGVNGMDGSSGGFSARSMDGSAPGPSSKRGRGSKLLQSKGFMREWYAQDFGVDWNTVLGLALPILNRYTGRTNGSSIRYRDPSVAWSYYRTDPEWGIMQANKLKTELEHALAPFNVQVQHDRGELEIVPKPMHKGKFVKEILEQSEDASDGLPPDFIFIIGDDVSDEKMFSSVLSYVAGTSETVPSGGEPNALSMGAEAMLCMGEEQYMATKSPSRPTRSPRSAFLDSGRVFTCTVGKKPSIAGCYVEKVAEVHSLLTALTKQQSADAAGVSGASATESAPGLDRHG